MKKNLFLAVATCVALASCVNETNDFPQLGKGKLLSFNSPVMHNQVTRNHVGEIAPGSTYPTSEHFTVFAIEHDGDFAGWEASNVIPGFFPETGENVGNIGDNHWAPSTDYYLPTEPNRKLSFAAYSPTRSAADCDTIMYGANGLVVKDWVMPEEDPYDLMYSERTVNVEQPEVAIKFNHALSSIHFAFAKPLQNGPHQVIVTKIAVKGKDSDLFNVGTFQDKVLTNNPTGSPEWSGLAEVDAPEEYILFENRVFEVPTSNPEEATNVSAFMPIPQNITSNMKLILSYKIKQSATDQVYQEVNDLEIPFTDFIITGTTEPTKTWEMSKRYIYNITFGALTKIYFHPEVSDWTTVGNAGTYVVQ